MGVSLLLRAFDPSLAEPFRSAGAGDAAPLREWLAAWRHAPDPEEIAAGEARLAHLEALAAPVTLLDHARTALDRARFGPLASLDLRAASADELQERALLAAATLDLHKSWDVVHYGLDPARRARESALHWRLRGERPTPYDLALYGHHRSPLAPPELPDPEPAEALEAARGWEDAFHPYDRYENDAAQVEVIADAIDLVPSDAFARALAGEWPEHVYGRPRPAQADLVREEASELRDRLAAFYRRAAERGFHVETEWVT